MKIEKAIELNEDNIEYFEADGRQECADALKLGIEALKVVYKIRHYPFPDEILQLPGETKD